MPSSGLVEGRHEQVVVRDRVHLDPDRGVCEAERERRFDRCVDRPEGQPGGRIDVDALEDVAFEARVEKVAGVGPGRDVLKAGGSRGADPRDQRRWVIAGKSNVPAGSAGHERDLEDAVRRRSLRCSRLMLASVRVGENVTPDSVSSPGH